MDINALQTFITIYECGNLHKAAEQLFFSQQGLSRLLKNLEKEYGCRFFMRGATGLIPTEEGRRFYESALRMRREMAELSRDLTAMTSGEKEIEIACAYGTLNLLYPKIQAFYESHRQIHIRWKEYPDLAADQRLRDEEVGLLLYVEGERQDKFEKVPLFSEKCSLLVYEGHRFWDRKSLRVSDLQGERILIEGRQFHIYQKFLDACAAEKITPYIAAETTEISLLQNLCRLHEGIAVVPTFIAELYRENEVRAIPLADTDFKFEGGLACLKNKTLTEEEQILWDFVRNAEIH